MRSTPQAAVDLGSFWTIETPSWRFDGGFSPRVRLVYWVSMVVETPRRWFVSILISISLVMGDLRSLVVMKLSLWWINGRGLLRFRVSFVSLVYEAFSRGNRWGFLLFQIGKNDFEETGSRLGCVVARIGKYMRWDSKDVFGFKVLRSAKNEDILWLSWWLTVQFKYDIKFSKGLEAEVNDGLMSWVEVYGLRLLNTNDGLMSLVEVYWLSVVMRFWVRRQLIQVEVWRKERKDKVFRVDAYKSTYEASMGIEMAIRKGMLRFFCLQDDGQQVFDKDHLGEGTNRDAGKGIPGGAKPPKPKFDK